MEEKDGYMTGWRDAYRNGVCREKFFAETESKQFLDDYMRGHWKGVDDFDLGK